METDLDLDLETARLIEQAIWVIVPWLSIGIVVLVERILTGKYKVRWSYFLTALILSGIFFLARLHIGVFGWGEVFRETFIFSSVPSLFFLALVCAYERLKEKA